MNSDYECSSCKLKPERNEFVEDKLSVIRRNEILPVFPKELNIFVLRLNDNHKAFLEILKDFICKKQIDIYTISNLKSERFFVKIVLNSSIASSKSQIVPKKCFQYVINLIKEKNFHVSNLHFPEDDKLKCFEKTLFSKTKECLNQNAVVSENEWISSCLPLNNISETFSDDNKLVNLIYSNNDEDYLNFDKDVNEINLVSNIRIDNEIEHNSIIAAKSSQFQDSQCTRLALLAEKCKSKNLISNLTANLQALNHKTEEIKSLKQELRLLKHINHTRFQINDDACITSISHENDSDNEHVQIEEPYKCNVHIDDNICIVNKSYENDIDNKNIQIEPRKRGTCDIFVDTENTVSPFINEGEYNNDDECENKQDSCQNVEANVNCDTSGQNSCILFSSETLKENNLLATRLSSMDAEINLQGEAENKEKEIELWKRQFEQSVKILDEHVVKVQFLEKSNKLLNATIDEIEEDLQEVFNAKQALQEQVDKMTIELNDLKFVKFKNDEMAQEIEMWKSEYDNTNSLVQNLKKEISFIKDDTEMKVQNEQLLYDMKAMEENIKVLLQQIKEKDLDLSNKESNLEKNNVVIREQKAYINVLEYKNSDLQIEVNSYEAKTNELMKEKNFLLKENDACRKLSTSINDLTIEKNKLLSTVEELSEAKEIMQMENSKIIQDFSALQQSFEEVTKENYKLGENLKKLENQFKEKDLDLSNKQSCLEKNENIIKEQNTYIDALKCKSVEFQVTLHDYELKINDLEKEKECLLQKNAVHEKLSSCSDKLQTEKNELSSSVEILTTEKEAIQAEKDKIIQENNILHQSLEKISKEKYELEENLKKLENQHKENNLEFANKLSCLEESNNIIEKQKSHVFDLECENSELKTRLNNCEIKLTELVKENEHLLQEYDACKILSITINDLTAEKNKLLSSMESLNKQKEDFQVEKDKIMQEYNALKQSVKEISKGKSELEDNLKMLEDQCKEKDHKLVSKQSCLEKNEIIIKEQQTHILALKCKNTELEASLCNSKGRVNELLKEKDSLLQENDACKKLSTCINELMMGKNELLESFEQMNHEKGVINIENEKIVQECDTLQQSVKEIIQEKFELIGKHNNMQRSVHDLENELSKKHSECEKLSANLKTLENELSSLKMSYEVLNGSKQKSSPEENAANCYADNLIVNDKSAKIIENKKCENCVALHVMVKNIQEKTDSERCNMESLVKELNKAIIIKDAEIKRMFISNKKLQEIVNFYDSQCKNFAADIINRNSATSAEVELLTAEKESLEMKKNKLFEKCTDLQNQVDKITQNETNLEHKKYLLQSEVQNLKEINMQLQKELETLKETESSFQYSTDFSFTNLASITDNIKSLFDQVLDNELKKNTLIELSDCSNKCNNFQKEIETFIARNSSLSSRNEELALSNEKQKLVVSAFKLQQEERSVMMANSESCMRSTEDKETLTDIAEFHCINNKDRTEMQVINTNEMSNFVEASKENSIEDILTVETQKLSSLIKDIYVIVTDLYECFNLCENTNDSLKFIKDDFSVSEKEEMDRKKLYLNLQSFVSWLLTVKNIVKEKFNSMTKKIENLSNKSELKDLENVNKVLQNEVKKLTSESKDLKNKISLLSFNSHRIEKRYKKLVEQYPHLKQNENETEEEEIMKKLNISERGYEDMQEKLCLSLEKQAELQRELYKCRQECQFYKTNLKHHLKQNELSNANL